MPLITGTKESRLATNQAVDNFKSTGRSPQNNKQTSSFFDPASKFIAGAFEAGARRVSSAFGAASAFDNPNTTVDNGLRSPYAGGLSAPRTGFVVTSDLWQQSNKALLLHAGPSEAQWSIPLRASFEDIKDGRAHYSQSRSRPSGGLTYFNIPTVAFTFQSGNILPMPVTSKDTVREGLLGITLKETEKAGFQVPFGLQDFYYFLELINQPPMIPSGPNEGKHNYIWVYYTSVQLPLMVLKGYIEPEGVSWTDSSEAPNGFTWSATMAVYESSPDLSDATSNMDAYLDHYVDDVQLF